PVCSQTGSRADAAASQTGANRGSAGSVPSRKGITHSPVAPAASDRSSSRSAAVGSRREIPAQTWIRSRTSRTVSSSQSLTVRPSGSRSAEPIANSAVTPCRRRSARCAARSKGGRPGGRSTSTASCQHTASASRYAVCGASKYRQKEAENTSRYSGAFSPSRFRYTRQAASSYTSEQASTTGGRLGAAGPATAPAAAVPLLGTRPHDTFTSTPSRVESREWGVGRKPEVGSREEGGAGGGSGASEAGSRESGGGSRTSESQGRSAPSARGRPSRTQGAARRASHSATSASVCSTYPLNSSASDASRSRA